MYKAYKNTDAVQAFDPKKQQPSSKNPSEPLWQKRENEPHYAKLQDKDSQIKNRYGKPIDLLDITDRESPNLSKNRSLFINNNPKVGANPHRNKQHGFFFNADNCIGCHACEAACSEKNNNPAHIAFRSVGYVEGGSYPDYQRLNISMACNHCDDPVCLKGCPTRAYTKHAEYGAVLQDPETCFGCGYCTWVCPYNAPQLDPIKGQVSKCNMCVDRLEEGLKPACVSACVGNALDFGVIENIPENRQQCKTSIPGFPDPSITHPNIRFQQTKDMPLEMNRTDSVAIKYVKDQQGDFKPVVDQTQGKTKQWSFNKLNSKENPLVAFTLLAQAAYGMFFIVLVAALFNISTFVHFIHADIFMPFSLLSVGIMSFALLMSVTHLGKPMRFYRGFNNLRYSPMSREGFGLALFSTFVGLAALFAAINNQWLNQVIAKLTTLNMHAIANTLPVEQLQLFSAILALVAGFAGLYYMNQCYQIKARPFWHHWQTTTAFAGNSLSLGALLSALIVLPYLHFTEQNSQQALLVFTLALLSGVLLEGIGLIAHSRAMNNSNNEGGAAHYIQRTVFGKSYWLRNYLLLFTILSTSVLLIVQLTTTENHSTTITLFWFVLAFVNLISAIISRALFYVLVIPTTMPGAFFWKNKSFEQHAREIGLADNPATGVAPTTH